MAEKLSRIPNEDNSALKGGDLVGAEGINRILSMKTTETPCSLMLYSITLDTLSELVSDLCGLNNTGTSRLRILSSTAPWSNDPLVRDNSIINSHSRWTLFAWCGGTRRTRLQTERVFAEAQGQQQEAKGGDKPDGIHESSPQSANDSWAETSCDSSPESSESGSTRRTVHCPGGGFGGSTAPYSTREVKLARKGRMAKQKGMPHRRPAARK